MFFCSHGPTPLSFWLGWRLCVFGSEVIASIIVRTSMTEGGAYWWKRAGGLRGKREAVCCSARVCPHFNSTMFLCFYMLLGLRPESAAAAWCPGTRVHQGGDQTTGREASPSWPSVPPPLRRPPSRRHRRLHPWGTSNTQSVCGDWVPSCRSPTKH